VTARLEAALLVLACAACSGADPVPEGTALTIDGVPILASDVETVAATLRLWMPGTGRDTSRAYALEAGFLPRAIAWHDFPEGVVQARAKATAAMAMLHSKVAFEDVQRQFSEVPVPATPRSYRRGELDPILGAATFGLPAGSVPDPIEATFGIVIARVDLPLPDDGPRQDEAILSMIVMFYDPSLVDAEYRIERGRERMLNAKYVERTPGAFAWLPAAVRAKLPDPPR